MKGCILLIISILTLQTSTLAQGLHFSEPRWDFGTVAEEGPKVEHPYRFRNDTPDPIVIQRLQSTCGCTTADYPRAPIMPGQEGAIDVTFDPLWRAGRNIRDIYIYTSASVEPTVLRLSGTVTPRFVPLEERYPYKLERHEDAVRIEATHYPFRALPRGELTQTIIAFTNPSKEDLTIEFRNRNEGSTLQTFYARELKGGAEQVVELSYLIEEESTVRGHLRDTLDIYINGRLAQHPLTVSGLIVEKR